MNYPKGCMKLVQPKEDIAELHFIPDTLIHRMGMAGTFAGIALRILIHGRGKIVMEFKGLDVQELDR